MHRLGSEALGHSAYPAAGPIRLLIVDDSLVARTVLGRMLEAHGAFLVAGEASNAHEALALLARMHVDIILLDLEMPGMDGLTALPELIAASNGARVIIVSAAAADGAAATVKALTLGAADTLLKPHAGGFAGSFAGLLVERLLRIGHAGRAAVAAPEGGETPPPVRSLAARAMPVGCLAIGSSTGGLHALADFFAALPAAFAAPILVTQHLPPPFMPVFADQLRELSGRPARVATEGMAVTPGALIVAPGDAHLTPHRAGEQVTIRLDRAPAASGCMPSVDPMFRAVAECYGVGGVGVVLTGMGRDGLIGARTIVDIGGEVMVQDAASAVIWGMPGVIAGAGLAAAVLPPARLAARIGRRATGAQAWS